MSCIQNGLNVQKHCTAAAQVPLLVWVSACCAARALSAEREREHKRVSRFCICNIKQKHSMQNRRTLATPGLCLRVYVHVCVCFFLSLRFAAFVRHLLLRSWSCCVAALLRCYCCYWWWLCHCLCVRAVCCMLVWVAVVVASPLPLPR